MNEPKRPSQLWVEYHRATYGSALLPGDLQREIRLAFHGGIEAAFKVLLTAAKEEPLPEKDEFIQTLMNFRRHNKASALNL